MEGRDCCPSTNNDQIVGNACVVRHELETPVRSAPGRSGVRCTWTHRRTPRCRHVQSMSTSRLAAMSSWFSLGYQDLLSWVFSGTVTQNGRRHRGVSCVSSVLASDENLEKSDGTKSMTMGRFRPAERSLLSMGMFMVYERPNPTILSCLRLD